MGNIISEEQAEDLRQLAELATIDVQELTDHMKQVLLHRQDTATDAEAARRAGVKPDTVNTWKRTKPAFKVAYDALMVVRDNEVELLGNFDRDEFIEAKLIDPSLKRLHEIVTIPINRYTDAATIAQIRQTAVGILHDRGLLKDPDKSPNQVTVIVEQHIAEGKSYRPPWKKVHSPTPGVEVQVPNTDRSQADTAEARR